jgi:putative NADH-flavin reductase
MNILIFGSSGATGQEIVRQALQQGHHVTAFARTPAKLSLRHDNLKIVQGDATDAASVQSAMAGHDAVLCALGSSPPSKRDPTVMTCARNIVDAMQSSGVDRFIYLSFLGVPEGRDQLSALFKHFVAPVVLRHPTKDHEEKESMIKQSTLQWTIVRAPKLTGGVLTGTYRAGEDVHARSIVPSISRADVADFMLRQLSDSTYIRKAPGVMK